MAEDKQVRNLREKLEKVLEANKNETAIDMLEKLFELEPKNARWPHKRGDLLRKLGKDKEAVTCYEAAVSIYADQGFIARAVAMAKTVLTLDPSRIDILERVDPNAAQQLSRRDTKQAPTAKRHAMVVGDDAPAAQPAAKKHPMLLDEDLAPPPPTAAKRAAAPAPAPAPPPTAAKRHPMILDEAPAAAPPVPARKPVAAPAPAAPPVVPARKLRARPVTLDQIELPPPVQTLANAAAIPPTARIPDVAEVYGKALGSLPELHVDPHALANETRFSDSPPRPGTEVELSEAEVQPRQTVSEVESQRPEPPTAMKLSKLPLFPLFAEVPKEALAEMIAGTELIELAHGEYVMRKGDPGNALYGIVEGSVGVVVPGQLLSLTLAEGDVFGESCLLQDEKRHADVVVQGHLVALRVPREVLTRLFGRHPKLAEVLLELLTRRLLGNLLQTSPLFQEFDAGGRRELARLFEIRRAPSGTMLSIVGKKMDGLYISLTGTLSIQQPGAPERIAPPGSMFGQNTLLSNEPSQVDIKTRVNMVVLRLPSSAFTRVAMQYPSILARLTELSTSEVVKITT